MKIYKIPGTTKVGDTIKVWNGTFLEDKKVLSVGAEIWEDVSDQDQCIYHTDRVSFVTVTV